MRATVAARCGAEKPAAPPDALRRRTAPRQRPPRLCPARRFPLAFRARDLRPALHLTLTPLAQVCASGADACRRVPPKSSSRKARLEQEGHMRCRCVAPTASTLAALAALAAVV